MAFLNPVLTRGGLPLLNRNGGARVRRVPNAPNGVDAGLRAYIIRSGDGQADVAITVPADVTYTRAVIVWRAPGRRLRAWRFAVTPGTTRLGLAERIMGDLAEIEGVQYEVLLENEHGLGSAPNRLTPTYEAPPEGQTVTAITIGEVEDFETMMFFITEESGETDE